MLTASGSGSVPPPLAKTRAADVIAPNTPRFQTCLRPQVKQVDGSAEAQRFITLPRRRLSCTSVSSFCAAAAGANAKHAGSL